MPAAQGSGFRVQGCAGSALQVECDPQMRCSGQTACPPLSPSLEHQAQCVLYCHVLAPAQRTKPAGQHEGLTSLLCAGGQVKWGHLAAADPSFGGTEGKYDLVEEFLPGPPPKPQHMQPGVGRGSAREASAPGASGALSGLLDSVPLMDAISVLGGSPKWAARSIRGT